MNFFRNKNIRCGIGIHGIFYNKKNLSWSVKSYEKSNNMASLEPRWKTERDKLTKITWVEKKEFYNVKDYLPLTSVDIWPKYFADNPGITAKKPTRDDLLELKKTKLNESLDNVKNKVSIFRGDITKLEVDAIVNAANSFLRAGGGVDGAIHRAAGPLLQEECNTLNGCPTGSAKITGGYGLPARYVIHTVGPQDGSPEKLVSCYESCFSLLQENHIRSIAFPCISTGIYGFPNRLAAHIALRTARKYLEKDDNLRRIIFCTFMPIDVDIYETLLQIYFPVQEHNYKT